MAENYDARRFDIRHSGVVHVLHSLDRGGAELRTVGLVQRTGARFDFLLLKSRVGALEAEVRGAGHQVTKIALRVRNFVGFFKYFRAEHRTMVHLHDGAASGPLLLLAALAGVRVRVVHFRSDAIGGSDRFIKSFYMTISRRLVAMLATDLVGVSPGSLTHGWKLDWESDQRCRVIPNGIDANHIRSSTAPASVIGEAPGLLTILFVGRTDPAKNQARALEIWADLAARRPARLVVVGTHDAALEEMARNLTMSCSRQSFVELIGEVSDVRPYLAVADVMLITSRREGLPGAMLESLAFGLPVLASDLPGTRWIASKVEGVELLSLTRPDDDWVSVILNDMTYDRQSIRDSFDASGFTIETALANFERLWMLDDRELQT